jgi:casein kinase II subunit beta
MGLSDLPHLKSVKLYCAKCEDIYNPKSSRHAAIDGAYFGASFHNILFQVYPALIPDKSRRRYEPKIFGFKVHAAAALARWQDNDREMMKRRLKAVGRDGESSAVENVGFLEDGTSEGEDELEEDELALAGARGNGDGEMEEIQQSVQGA